MQSNRHYGDRSRIDSAGVVVVRSIACHQQRSCAVLDGVCICVPYVLNPHLLFLTHTVSSVVHQHLIVYRLTTTLLIRTNLLALGNLLNQLMIVQPVIGIVLLHLIPVSARRDSTLAVMTIQLLIVQRIAKHLQSNVIALKRLSECLPNRIKQYSPSPVLEAMYCYMLCSI